MADFTTDGTTMKTGQEIERIYLEVKDLEFVASRTGKDEITLKAGQRHKEIPFGQFTMTHHEATELCLTVLKAMDTGAMIRKGSWMVDHLSTTRRD